MSHDREIIDALSQLDVENFSGTLWRTSWKTRSPLQGGVAGGRWSPKSTLHNQIVALYTSLEQNTSMAELHYHLSQAPVFSSCAMVICELKVKNIKLLNLLNKKLLTELNIDTNNRKEFAQSQKIGSAAQFLGYQGIIVPSFRTAGNNCVLFLDAIDSCQLTITAKKEINWPAWIKQQK